MRGRAATTGEAAVALLHPQLAVWIAGGLRVARGVDRGGFGWAEIQVSGAKVGLELPGRAGAPRIVEVTAGRSPTHAGSGF